MSDLVKHTHPVVFGRREAGCPRCAELDAGAPVRTSPKWEAVNRRRSEDEQRSREIRAHSGPDHDQRCAAGQMCQFGQW